MRITTRTIKTTGMLTAAIAASVLLAGCTINIGTSDSSMMDDKNSSMMGNSSALTGNDLMFAQMMIPHHQQAVDMGTLAETRASDPKVKALAAKIKGEQAPEIAQMRAWLGLGPNDSTGHTMVMGGMLTDSQMAELKAASGAKFDKLYLTYMIGHHEGAISMAKTVLDSSNAEVKQLAENIVSSQTDEIAYMKQLLGK